MKATVVDTEAYVNRSIEERRKEVDEGKVPGKVMRPLNSFMLYRKAYANRTKDVCRQLHANQPVISQVCGDSWKIEPESIKDQFAEWARIERINHQNAHPDWKFSGRPSASKSLKRKRSLPSSSSNAGSVTPNMRTHEVANSMSIYDHLVGDFASIMNY